MRNLINFLWLSLFLILTACGGGGGSNDSSPNTPNITPLINPGSQYKKSKFYDLPVSGLFYSTDTWTGYTDKAGEFYYLPGEEISFRLVGVELGTIKAGSQISFSDLATDDERVYTDKVINLLSLFKVLDKDGNINNGVEISTDFIELLSSNNKNKQLKKSFHKKNDNDLNITDGHARFKSTLDKKLEKRNITSPNADEAREDFSRIGTKSNCLYYYPDIISQGLKTKISCDDHERAYWLSQYSLYVKKTQIDDPKQSASLSYEETEQRTKKIAEYIQIIPDFIDAFEEKTINDLASFYTDIGFTLLKASNADLEIVDPKHVDFAHKLFEGVIASNECMTNSANDNNKRVQLEACKEVFSTTAKIMGISIADEDNIAAIVATKVLQYAPQISEIQLTKKQFSIVATAAIGTTITIMSTGSEGRSASSNDAIRNIADIFSGGVIAYSKCRKLDALGCIAEISGVIGSSVDNIVKAGGAIGHNYIWSDVNQSIEFHEDYKKVMDYFISINFDMEIVSKNRGINASKSRFYEDIDYVINQYVENQWFRDDTSYKYSLRLKIYELFQSKDVFAIFAKGILSHSLVENTFDVGEQFTVNLIFNDNPLPTAQPNKLSCSDQKGVSGAGSLRYSPRFSFSQSGQYTIKCQTSRIVPPVNLKGREISIPITIIAENTSQQNGTDNRFLTSPVCVKNDIFNSKIPIRISSFYSNSKKQYWLNRIYLTLALANRSGHYGTDMAVTVGTPIVATSDGVVANYCKSITGSLKNNTLKVDTTYRNTDQRCKNGYGNYKNGNYVFINHSNGYTTQYLHLNKVFVKSQQAIKKGQLLGYSGNTGSSSGPHLHFSVKKLGLNIDPFPNYLWDYQDEPQDWIDKLGHLGALKTCGGEAVVTNSAPIKPAHVIASNGTPDYIRITGYESIGATKYEIYRSTSSSKTSMEKIGETGKLEYKDTTAVIDKNYFYRVKACNAIDCSGLSDQYDLGVRKKTSTEVKPVKPTLKSPGSPASPGTELTDKTPTLSWNSADRATYYKVAVKNVTTSQLVLNETNVTGTSIVTPTLVVGHKYYWDITACNSAGCSSEWSDSLFFQIKDNVTISTLEKAEILSPGSSTSPGIEITDRTPTMSLKKIRNATHYGVKLDDVTSGSIAFENKNVASTSFPLLSPLTIDHKYQWKARACNADGCGEWSNLLYFKVVDESQSLPIPNKPRNLQPGSADRDNSVNLDSKTITLQWSAENNASKYKLSLFDYNTTRYLIEDQYITGTSYDVSSHLDFGHQYFWDLRACNNNNECSSKERAHFNINGEIVEPDQPTGLTPGTTSRDNPQVLNDTSPTLRWSNANNADWYKVWVVKGNLSSSGVIVTRGVRANSNSYTVTGLLEGSRYWWYVEACNDDACTDSDYYAIEIEAPSVPALCPLRHFTNDQVSEYLQKGYRDGTNGITQVTGLQKFLNELGYNAGTADGIFGSGTESAVISYQNAKGLIADGKVGSNTKNKINSTLCN